MTSVVVLIAVFLFGFALGGLVVSLKRRKAVATIRREFEHDLERISAESLKRTQQKLDHMSPRSWFDS